MQWMSAENTVASLHAIGVDLTFLTGLNNALSTHEVIAPGDVKTIVKKCPKEEIIQDQNMIDRACLLLPPADQLKVKRLYAKTKNIQFLDETDTGYHEQMQNYEFDLTMLQSYLRLAEELKYKSQFQSATSQEPSTTATSAQNIIDLWHCGEYVKILLVKDPNDEEAPGETKGCNEVHMFGTVVRSATDPNQLEVQSSHFPARNLGLESTEFEFQRASECLEFQRCTGLQHVVYGNLKDDEEKAVSLYLNQIVTDVNVHLAVLAAQGALRPRGSAKHLQKIAGLKDVILKRMGDYGAPTLRHAEVGVTTRVEQRFNEHGKDAVRAGGGQWGREVGMARQFWAAVTLVAQHQNVIVFRSLFELCSSSLRWCRSEMHPYFTEHELALVYHQFETIVHENAPCLDNMAIGANDVLMYGSLRNRGELDTLREKFYSEETLGKCNVFPCLFVLR